MIRAFEYDPDGIPKKIEEAVKEIIKEGYHVYAICELAKSLDYDIKKTALDMAGLRASIDAVRRVNDNMANGKQKQIAIHNFLSED